MRIDAPPDEWSRRKIIVGHYGRLRVFAASRLDLIAMKVVAERDQDIDALMAMRVRADDVQFVRSYLDTLVRKSTNRNEINDARQLLDSLEIHDSD
ncbi:MAG: hypothetical protein SGJ09_17695 [Phycisphaerae bacterium]|nr:hypothetical protein [Phycisphaerae bacterium]